MLGGYNIEPLIDLLDDAEVGAVAAEGLKKTLLMFDQFHDVRRRPTRAMRNAKAVLQSWADAEWFTTPSRSAGKHHRERVQGDRRDQHRRPVAGARRLEPPRHPAARPGHAEERRVPASRPRKRASAARSSSSRSCAPRATWSPTSATWSAPAPRASRPPTPCCGSPAKTFPSCRTSASAASASAARSPRSSTTPWKTPARCRSSSTSAR